MYDVTVFCDIGVAYTKGTEFVVTNFLLKSAGLNYTSEFLYFSSTVEYYLAANFCETKLLRMAPKVKIH